MLKQPLAVLEATPKEIAQRLRLEVGTVYRWIREHKIEVLRFGRSWRIPMDARGLPIMLAEAPARPENPAPPRPARKRSPRRARA